MKKIKDLALDLYNNNYTPEVICKLLKIEMKELTKWISKVDLQVVKGKTTSITDAKNQFIKDIPDIIKGLTLAGYSKAEIAITLNIDEDDLDDLIENVEEIFKKYTYARILIHGKVVKAYLQAIFPGKKIERHIYYDYKKDSNGNIIDFENSTPYVGKVIEKEDRGDPAGMIKWMEVNKPDKWNIKDKSMSDKIGDYGIAEVNNDYSDDDFEKKAIEHQAKLRDEAQKKIEEELD